MIKTVSPIKDTDGCDDSEFYEFRVDVEGNKDTGQLETEEETNGRKEVIRIIGGDAEAKYNL